jgi:hypothetical protein
MNSHCVLPPFGGLLARNGDIVATLTVYTAAPCQGRLAAEHTVSQRLNRSTPGLVSRSYIA